MAEAGPFDLPGADRGDEWRWFGGLPAARREELARTCPGALAFAFALVERTDTWHHIGVDLVADLKASRKLDEALAYAVEGWLAASLNVVEPHELHPTLRRRWQLAWSYEPELHRRFVHDRRLLLRRMKGVVGAADLLTPPWIAFVPEDIPAGAVDQVRWLRVMGRFAPAPEPCSLVTPEHEAYARWLSAHAIAIAHAVQENLLDEWRVTDALNTWAEEGLDVPREATVGTVLGNRPARDLVHVEVPGVLLDEAAYSHGLQPEELVVRPLASLPLVLPHDPALCPAFVETVGDLGRTAARFANCAFDQLDRYLALRRLLVTVVLGPEPALLELDERLDGSLVVNQAKLPGNSHLDEDAALRLEAWLERLAVDNGRVVRNGDAGSLQRL